MKPTDLTSHNGLLQRLRRRARDESGVALVIVSISMIVFLGMAALAIDLGMLWQAKRQAQSAADAGALAGMQDLPTFSTAQATASYYAARNFPGSAPATVQTQYHNDPNQIRVTVTKTIPTIFGGIFGIGSETVKASAAATKNPASVPSALFAASTSCSGYGVTLESNNGYVNGGAHANGKVDFQGDHNQIGAVTYGGPNNCPPPPVGNNNTITSLGVDSKTEIWPADYSGVNQPACTFSAASYTFATDGATLQDGVYCATGNITISGANMNGKVTFIANTLTVTGSNDNFRPYPAANGLTFYQKASSTLQFQGSNTSGGTVFAPNATVIVNGSSFTATGFIEAQQIDVQTANFRLDGNGPTMPGAAGALSE